MIDNIPQGRMGRQYAEYQQELAYAEYISRQRERFEMACWEDQTAVTETGFAMWLRQQSMDDREEPGRL